RFLWTCLYVLPPILIASFSFITSISFLLLFIHEIAYFDIPHSVSNTIIKMSISESVISSLQFNLSSIDDSSSSIVSNRHFLQISTDISQVEGNSSFSSNRSI
ncbi:hypothetical protein PFISCL1PPCAC_7444, partial [Pristionchus fissidentatus]